VSITGWKVDPTGTVVFAADGKPVLMQILMPGDKTWTTVTLQKWSP